MSNPTTLQERIARLNLPSATSTAPSSSNSPASRSTGASGKISDKIKRFQDGANGEAPLIPTGSFGLGGIRREPSSGAAGEKGRVASLGGGRAAVPLGVVRAGTARSASASSTVGRDGTTDMKRAASASSRGSSVDDSALLAASATPSPEPSSPSTPAFLSSATRADSISSVDQAGSRTPASISSMNVETGSMKSDSGADAAGLSTPTATSPLSSPLSSPIVDAVLINESDPIAINLDNSPDPSLLGALRGPVASLKAPTRTASTLSVSSMVVEDGSVASDGVGNLEEVRTPTGLDGKTFETETFPSTVGGEEGTGLGLEVEMEEDEDTEKAKEARTKAELEQYEEEIEDATKAPVVEAANERVEEPAKEIVDEAAEGVVNKPLKEVVEEENETPIVEAAVPLKETEDSLAALPLEPEPEARSIEAFVSAGTVLSASVPVDTTQVGLPESTQSDDENQGSEGGYGDFLDEFADEEETAGLGPSGMPLVKCSDCLQEVDLLELADHTCAPKPPSPNAFLAPIISAPVSPPRAIPDVPQDDAEEEEDELADPDIGRRLSSRPTFPIAATDSPRDATPHQMSVSHSASSLDDFVPQSESLIPDDVIDDYADDAPDSPIAPPSFRSSFPIPAARPIASDVPEDFDDDEVEELSGEPQMSRSASGRRLPGVDDSDEEGYEGGSVTIVRQTLSHRTTESG